MQEKLENKLPIVKKSQKCKKNPIVHFHEKFELWIALLLQWFVLISISLMV